MKDRLRYPKYRKGLGVEGWNADADADADGGVGIVATREPDAVRWETLKQRERRPTEIPTKSTTIDSWNDPIARLTGPEQLLITATNG